MCLLTNTYTLFILYIYSYTIGMKTPEQAKKWLTMTKKLTRSSLSYTLKNDLQDRLLSLTPTTDSGSGTGTDLTHLTLTPSSKLQSLNLPATYTNALCSLSYWKCHDINSNNIVNRVWTQYAYRQTEYSIAAIKTSLKHSDISVIYTKALQCLVRLCCIFPLISALYFAHNMLYILLILA